MNNPCTLFDPSFSAMALDSIDDLIWVKDCAGQYLSVNKAFTNWFCLEHDFIINNNDFAFQTHEKALAYRLKDQEAMAIKHPIVYETEETSPNGHIAYFEVKIKPIFDVHGTPIGILGMSHNIMDRQQLKHRLHLSEEKFSNIFMINPDSASIIRLIDGVYLKANEAFTRLSGYSQEEVVGKSVLEIGLWADLREREFVLKQLHETGELLSFEATFRRKDGFIIYGLLSAKVFFESDEGYILIVAKDITARKHEEEELRDLNSELERKVTLRTQELLDKNQLLQGMNADLSQLLTELQTTQESLLRSEKMSSLLQLVSRMAHEVNTPIGVCITMASHLNDITQKLASSYHLGKMKRTSLEEYIESSLIAVESLLLNSDRVAKLITSFKQVSVYQFYEKIRFFNLWIHINTVLLLLNSKIQATGHHILLTCDENLDIAGYPKAFTQIITNLLLNSLTHAYAPGMIGQISLEVKKMDTYLLLTYKDDGNGMAEEFASKAFDPFFTTKRTTGHLGLGLSVVYNLVTQLYKGQILCQTHLGLGTLFEITLPLLQQEESSYQEE